MAEQTSVKGVRFSMQYEQDGKTKRVTGIDAHELGKLFGVPAAKERDVVLELASRPTSNGSHKKAADLTEDEKAARKAYNAQRAANMTPEAKAREKARRQEYNKKRAAEMKEAMALLRAQRGDAPE